MHERAFCILLVKVCFICVEVVHILQPVQKSLIHVACTCTQRGMHTHNMYMYNIITVVQCMCFQYHCTLLLSFVIYLSSVHSSIRVHVCTHANVVL